MVEIQQVTTVPNELGEGPLWNPREQRLYWVDIEKSCYHWFHPATGTHEVVEVGERVGVLAFREKGGMVMATEGGFAFWDPAARKLQRLGNPEAGKAGCRFNDGAIDRRGRFWAGSYLVDDSHNALYRLDPDLSIHRMETGITISNGIAWSPDDKIMYYTDSVPGFIYAYDFDLASGAIANRRVIVDNTGRRGVPDGMTVDSQGFIWSARWGDWCLERYHPDGKLERRIDMPVQCPSSVMFGGPDLDTLYVTSARIEIPEADRPGRPLDGCLFCLQPGVRGLPEPFFAG